MKPIDVAHSYNKKESSPLRGAHRLFGEKGEGYGMQRLLKDIGINCMHFHTLFDNLPYGMSLNKFVYGQHGEPIDFVQIVSNPMFTKVHPFHKKLLLKKARQAAFGTIGSSDWLRIYGDVDAAGLFKTFEAYCKPLNRWYQIFVYSPMKNYFFSVFYDITAEKKKAKRKNAEGKKAKEALVSTEKRFRRLYETTQDGIMARDLHGKMIDCNPAYAKMLGYTKKELRQRTIQELLPKKWHAQREKVVAKVLQTGRSVVFEREYVRKDGSIFPASVRTWRLKDGRGKVIGIWSVVRDISQQKEQQKNLEKLVKQRTKQLKDSERLIAIGQTAGMVGHDLRNPLQTLTGELYLAKNEAEALPSGDSKINLQESIRIIEEQVSYMDKIISDLQAFVRPINMNKSTINVQSLVAKVLSSVVIPENVLVNTKIQNDFPQVEADTQLLKRVLINLVTNAVQAMPNGGTLTITAQKHVQNQVSLSVKDTGVGIAEKIKPHLFTPLFTTKPRGQGFGLAVCKRVIEAHGGNISFESIEGKGAEFTIRFPAN